MKNLLQITNYISSLLSSNKHKFIDYLTQSKSSASGIWRLLGVALETSEPPIESKSLASRPLGLGWAGGGTP